MWSVFDCIDTFSISDWIFLFFFLFGTLWLVTRFFTIVEYIYEWIEKKKGE